MNCRENREDILSLRRALLDSARLDARAMPTSVRKRLLAAATVAGISSTSVGAGAVSGALNGPLVLVAKWLGLGTLLVSVGAASYHVTGRVLYPHATASTVAERSTRFQEGTARRDTSAGLPLPTEAGVSGERTSDVKPRELTPFTEVATRLPSQRSRGTVSPNATESNVADRSSLGRDAPVSALVPTAKSGWQSPAELPSTLTAELGMLERARSRLAAGDPGGTLASLDTYAREFPSGGLQPEAMLLRIQALLQGGEGERARELSSQFLGQYPSSPHAVRIRLLLQSSGPDAVP